MTEERFKEFREKVLKKLDEIDVPRLIRASMSFDYEVVTGLKDELLGTGFVQLGENHPDYPRKLTEEEIDKWLEST